MAQDLLDFTEQLMYPCVKHIPVGMRYLQSDDVGDWLQGGSRALKGWIIPWLVECEVEVTMTTHVSEEWESILYLPC